MTKWISVFQFLALTATLLASGTSPVFATDAAPHCVSRDREIPIENDAVLELKKTTKNQYKTQEHVSGTISTVYPDRNGHKHFAIKIGPDTDDQIEVVYNEVFGVLPQLSAGMTVEACGEYITSNEATVQYPPSPVGAIIHWVHINPNQGVDSHASGFLLIDGKLCGQDASKADHNGPRRKHH